MTPMIKDILSAATTTLIACAALQPNSVTAAEESSANKFMHRADFKELAARFDDPARAKWQKPEKAIASLGPLKGKTVADIGAGTGYFSFRIAQQAKKVIAVDIDQRFLDYIAQKKQTQKTGANIETRLTKPDSSGLKPGEADLVLIVDTYHHIEGRVEVLQETQKSSAQRRRARDHRLQEDEDAAGSAGRDAPRGR